jgi:plasmid stability protein
MGQKWTGLDFAARVRYHFDISFRKGGKSEVPDVLVRDLDEATLVSLKDRASGNGRSLGMELKLILEQAARQCSMATSHDLAEQMTRRLSDRSHTDSAQLLREDRLR